MQQWEVTLKGDPRGTEKVSVGRECHCFWSDRTTLGVLVGSSFDAKSLPICRPRAQCQLTLALQSPPW